MHTFFYCLLFVPFMYYASCAKSPKANMKFIRESKEGSVDHNVLTVWLIFNMITFFCGLFSTEILLYIALIANSCWTPSNSEAFRRQALIALLLIFAILLNRYHFHLAL